MAGVRRLVVEFPDCIIEQCKAKDLNQKVIAALKGRLADPSVQALFQASFRKVDNGRTPDLRSLLFDE